MKSNVTPEKVEIIEPLKIVLELNPDEANLIRSLIGMTDDSFETENLNTFSMYLNLDRILEDLDVNEIDLGFTENSIINAQ